MISDDTARRTVARARHDIIEWQSMTTLTHLECSQCGQTYDAGMPHNLCECGGPLLARYDLEKARQSWSRDWIPNGPSSMWRYAPCCR